MSLGLDVNAALPELRAHAESMMQDACIVERATGETTLDSVTLEEVPVYAPVYSGKCRIQRPDTQTRETVVGGVEFAQRGVYGQLPLSAVGIRKGDRLTVTAVGDTTDPDLLGLVASVEANLTKTHPTKRTLVMTEVE